MLTLMTMQYKKTKMKNAGTQTIISKPVNKNSNIFTSINWVLLRSTLSQVAATVKFAIKILKRRYLKAKVSSLN